MTRPTLAELQDRFQSAVLSGDEAFLGDIVDSPRERRKVLLGVYQNAYVLRLIEILGHDYEILHGYAGDTVFAELARAYVSANPSPHRNARWFGSRLPEFLSESDPWREHREFTDLAAIERALNDAFDDGEEPAVTLADLAAVAPERWGDLAFTPQPFVRRLDTATNAYAIWLALRNEETPPKARLLEADDAILAFRADLTSKIRLLGPDEAMMWDEMANGVRFGVLCEMMATYWDVEDAPARAAGYLQGWINAGLLAAETRSVDEVS